MKLIIRDILYKEKPLSYASPPHALRTYELVYVDRGAVHVIIEGKTDFSMGRGETCFFLPGQTHSLWAEKESAPNFLNIHFSCDLAGLSRFSKKKFAVTDDERDLLRALADETKENSLESAAMRRSLLSLFLIKLLRRVRAGKTKVDKAISATQNLREILADKAKAHVASNLAETLTIDSIAKALHVSNSHLAHTFNAVEGMSLKQYIQAERINLAKEMLRDTTLSVTEIADRLGFSSIHHLSRTFKSKTGFTPTEYSRSLKS